MKLAVTAWDLSSVEALQRIPDQAAKAEAMGFEGFWLPENHFAGPAALSAPLILLAAAAARTSTIDLGTTSLVLPIRHPVSVAEEVAMLDQIAQGRLILGLGRGFSEDLFDVFGVDPREKRALFKQSLTRMLTIWSGEAIHHKDDRGLYLSPRPYQSPHPRLWIAAFGPLALKQAAAFGCPYLASPMETFSELSQNFAQYRAALKAADQAQPNVVPVMRTIFITEDAALATAVREQLGQESRRAAAQDQPDQPDQPAFIVGAATFVQDTLARYSEDLGVNYLIARGRIKGITETQQLASHAALITLFR